MRVNKAAVIGTACEIADEKGLNNVSLKAVAEKLGIKTPSLYNHIESLEELLREAAHKGMREMNAELLKSAVGKSGASAMREIALGYQRYMLWHPGVYETIQWAVWNGNEQTAAIFAEYTDMLRAVIASLGFEEQATDELIRLFAGFLHGYNTMRLGFAKKEPEAAKKELCDAVDTLILGAEAKYRKS